MDWKTFIVEIVKVMAWPGVIFTFFYLFKAQIQELFKSLSELKIGKASIVFGKQILANKVSKKERSEGGDQEHNSSLTEEEIMNITDDDYEFMREISKNEAFMPASDVQIYKYNSLVNHGYFIKVESGSYKPTAKGLEILSVLKSIYH